MAGAAHLLVFERVECRQQRCRSSPRRRLLPDHIFGTFGHRSIGACDRAQRPLPSRTTRRVFVTRHFDGIVGRPG